MRAKTPVETKQSSKAIGDAIETKPVVPSIKKIRHESQEQTLPVLQPKIKCILFLFLLDIVYTLLNRCTCSHVNRHQCFLEIMSS